jgi:hypothetical protein
MGVDVSPAPMGTSFNIYLQDGVPSGIRIVEEDNWNGIALDFAKVDLKRIQGDTALAGAGVYVLVGDEDGDGTPMIYVGESELLSDRLKSHESGTSSKEFWQRATVFTASNEKLNKAHIRYMEARLVEIAKVAKRSKLDQNSPGIPLLSRQEKAFAEGFLVHILRILPLLGVRAFELPVETGPDQQAPVFELKGAGGANAQGQETSQGFLVYEGARARLDEVDSIQPWMSKARSELIESGVLVEQGGSLLLTQNRDFDSPSRAAMVILGRSVNGRTAWKTADGKSLREWQEDSASYG